MFRLKSSSRIKTSKLKSRRSEIIVHPHVEIVRILQKALIAMWQKLFLTRTVCAFPYYDCCGI